MDAGSLTIFAEIAIALAGFASLVSVIGARAGGDPPMLDANRLRNLVDTSLLLVVFSLVPMVLFAIGEETAGGWRVASALYALCLLVWGPIAARRQWRLHAAGIRVRRGWALAIWSLYLIGTTSVALGALGAPPWEPTGFYVLSLMANLIAGCLIFMLVIGSILIPLFEEG